MPLNLTTWAQIKGTMLLRRRLSLAMGRRSTRMQSDVSRRQRLAMICSLSLGVLLLIGAAVLSFFKPQGTVGEKVILADRDSGQIYARINDRLYPALNGISAQLATGSASKPEFVLGSEIRKWPTGPLIGIPGAPSQMPVEVPAKSQWAVCDSVDFTSGSSVVTETTVLAGSLAPGKVTPMTDGLGAVVSFNSKTYLVHDGVRSEVALDDGAVTAAVGIGSDAEARPVSRAVFDAIPANGELSRPVIPGAGSASNLGLGSGIVVGSIVRSSSPDGSSQLWVVLRSGVQQITPVVAQAIASSASFGTEAATAVAPDVLARAPHVQDLDFSAWPTRAVRLATRAANVLCLNWSRTGTAQDQQASVTTGVSAGLPLSADQLERVSHLVRDSRPGNQATSVYFAPDAGNWFQATGTAADSPARESFWWLSPSGVRYGVNPDSGDLKALGLTREPAVAPWSILGLLAPGPRLSQSEALRQQNTVTAKDEVETLPTQQATSGN